MDLAFSGSDALTTTTDGGLALPSIGPASSLTSGT
jgi:hypothetical protein